MKTLSQALIERKNQGYIPVIPDIKCISPKDGDLLQGRDAVEIAQSLVRVGAPVLSVVTAEADFGGSMELLEKICEVSAVPVLRKDFVHTDEDLYVTKAAGAKAVLLMYSMLEQRELECLYHKAYEIGLEVLLETCSLTEVLDAKRLGATLVGINNRNIRELELDDGDVSRTLALAKQLPPNVVLISESGINNRRDIDLAIQAGATAVLIGTAILKAPNMNDFYTSLCK